MFRSIDKWLPGYLESVFARPRDVSGQRHLLFCVTDHFEPFWNGAKRQEALDVVGRYSAEFSAVARDYHDADGRTPRHTFFYPQEDYDPACIEKLSCLCTQGFGEVEIHLHHRNDTAEGFRSKLTAFRDLLRNNHGLLGSDGTGKPRYGFIHGNWALCNSRPDGDWCGVNEELGVLRQTGCYADFTYPSAPSTTQPRMVNTIYYASDTGCPRACDRGDCVRVGGEEKDEGGHVDSKGIKWSLALRRENLPARADLVSSRPGKPEVEEEEKDEVGNLSSTGGSASVGKPEVAKTDERRLRKDDSDLRYSGTPTHPYSDTSLMLITGPLALDWRRRKWGIFPRLEAGAITVANPPMPERIDLWARQHIHVTGRPEWVFVKVHMHGCHREGAGVLPVNGMHNAFSHLQSTYNDGAKWNLHFLTAREMYNIARAAEAGKTGNPGDYRDFEITRPPAML
jgi:hypothetical protein